MRIEEILSAESITSLAKERFKEERSLDYLTGWFLAKETARRCDGEFSGDADSIRIAKTLVEIAKELPISIGDYHVFAGTQDDAFARSYALINPAFTVETFAGYCDPVAVFGDIDPIGDITQERIDELREYNRHSEFSTKLKEAYDPIETKTGEVVFFIEQVTGHLIPDLRGILKSGIKGAKADIAAKLEVETDASKIEYYKAMDISLDAVVIFANRYADIAKEKAAVSEGAAKQRYELMEVTLRKVPEQGAESLYEAIQSFILLWQVMCIEQAPNPFAFSVGNADRIFEPYRAMDDMDQETTAALFKHLLVFYNVADRSWAISQNLIVGGKSVEGEDLTSLSSYALLDAYFDMNLPQPILSVKLHKNTPEELYASLGRFFFTPGCLTPSIFNDDAMFDVLEHKSGVDKADLPDYAVAGCQEPLIMGKDNGNTTNSWLNLPKILELSLHDGISAITGNRLEEASAEYDYSNAYDILKNIREIFYKNTDKQVDEMVAAANVATEAIGILQVPFLSTVMGGIETGVDTRDTKKQGTKYNGSGCLIHGLSVIADSFVAIDKFLEERPQDAERLIKALMNNFEGEEEIHQYLLMADKYGNNIKMVDDEAVEVANKISDMIASKKNPLGNPFRADWSSPSTHLMYGFWVGATPDGRKSREQLGYGIDPIYGEAQAGMGFKILSNMKLPLSKMNGGYASHLGINPKPFKGETMEEKGVEFKEKIIDQLFFNEMNTEPAPFYLYVNVTTPDTLRKVLANPKKYAPSGVYIMRIHGTFVNFLDLSPEIQEDIIKRLDME